jgi:hypothetical protein
MKVAVIYTGALRTIRKTMRYFKQNVLLNPDVHVFACVQNDTPQLASEQESWISNELGDNLKHIEWFSLSVHNNWVEMRNQLLESMNICDNTRNYLKSSGSMIEYYQLQLAYIKMMKFERQHDFKYDYIIRARTDTIYAKPIDFHWLNWTDNDVEDRVEKIKNELVESNIETTHHNIIHYFMSTIVSDDIIRNIYNIDSKTTINRNNMPSIDALNDYIKNGSYILTLRNNLLYIVKREFFYLIPSLGTFYGYMRYPEMDPVYWWNAECQFDGACYNSNLNIHNYSTVFDDKSLYEYDEKRYFDIHYNILNPVMLYCLVRN